MIPLVRDEFQRHTLNGQPCSPWLLLGPLDAGVTVDLRRQPAQGQTDLKLLRDIKIINAFRYDVNILKWQINLKRLMYHDAVVYDRRFY